MLHYTKQQLMEKVHYLLLPGSDRDEIIAALKTLPADYGVPKPRWAIFYQYGYGNPAWLLSTFRGRTRQDAELELAQICKPGYVVELPE